MELFRLGPVFGDKNKKPCNTRRGYYCFTCLPDALMAFRMWLDAELACSCPSGLTLSAKLRHFVPRIPIQWLMRTCYHVTIISALVKASSSGEKREDSDRGENKANKSTRTHIVALMLCLSCANRHHHLLTNHY